MKRRIHEGTAAMAIHSISLDTSTPITADVDGDIWIVKTGVEVTTPATAIDGSGVNGNKTFLIYGDVIADGGFGLDLGDSPTRTGGDNGVHIMPGASVFATNYGIYSFGGGLDFTNEGTLLSSDHSGLYALDGGNRVHNLGLITSSVGAGVVFSDGNNVVVNEGTIRGSFAAVEVFDGATRIENFGVLTSDDRGVSLNGDGVNVVNAGMITCSGMAVSANGSGDVIDNSGTISTTYSGESWGAIHFYTSADDTGLVRNTGEITSGNFAVMGGSGNETVINQGLIRGNIDLGYGSDVYDGIGGEITGTVTGGGGGDTYRVDDAAITLVEVVAGIGTDTVESMVSWRLADNFENLTLLGTADTDGIGNSAENILSGNSGNNVLSGGAGADALTGDLGNDRLIGGSGKDSLAGSEGEDRLIGGLGRDVLTGGDDNDTFTFRSADKSAGVTADHITDFTSGEDVIDVSRIDARSATTNDNAFTFIGEDAFSGAAGELRFVAGATSHIEGDTNGDGIADFRVVFTNGAVIHAFDLVL